MWNLVAMAGLAAAAPKVDRVPQDFSTIQQAIDRGTAPVIEVGPGEWAGAVVRRPVDLRGDQAVIRSGPRYSGLGVGFSLLGKASDSEISGFTFACDGAKLDVGVYSSASRLGRAASYITVSDNTFRGCVQAITNTGRPTASCRPKNVDGGQYWLIKDNRIEGITSVSDDGQMVGGLGVFLFNTKYSEVLNNQFDGNIQDSPHYTTGGVVVAGCWDCTIAGNDFSMEGGRFTYAAISNLGFYQSGAAASRRLFIADNDATNDSSPMLDVNYRSYDSFGTQVFDNRGVAVIDHSQCGDGEIDTFEER